MLAFAADCLPIAVARTDGDRRLAVLHAGWRGLAEGVVAAGVETLGPGETAAVVGPAIGPCCYEVGDEVSALFDEDLTVDGRLDLWSAAERALRRAGVARVDRTDLCTRCHPELFFSHRRSGRARGAQGVIGAVAAGATWA
jgi:copper oxidase (laccase) domain-containing protein